jgi:hypothetical protein
MTSEPITPGPITPEDLESLLPPATRHDGWTPARQQEFIECLADTANVRAAARRVGMSVQSAYRLRRHPDADDFRRAWDLAVQDAWSHIRRVALDRVLNGEETQIEREGVVVAVQRKPCDPRFLIAMLDRAGRMSSDEHRVTNLLSELRDLIDQLPDREHWVGERLDPLHFRELDRLPPPPRAGAENGRPRAR